MRLVLANKARAPAGVLFYVIQRFLARLELLANCLTTKVTALDPFHSNLNLLQNQPIVFSTHMNFEGHFEHFHMITYNQMFECKTNQAGWVKPSDFEL